MCTARTSGTHAPRLPLSSAPIRAVVMLSMLLASLGPLIHVPGAHALFDLAPPLVNPIQSFVETFGRFLVPQDAGLQELRVHNVTVHRVQYTEQVAEHLKQQSASRFTPLHAPTSITGVVVTWDDHVVASAAREKTQTDAKGGSTSPFSKSSYHEVTYQVQMWVNGWGIDALWHEANQHVSTVDPFVVLNELPVEHELCFRVRLKVKQRRGFLAGVFDTETEGPWSEIITLSPSNEHSMEAIYAFLVANKAFTAVLAMCMGLGMLIVLRLSALYISEIFHSSRLRYVGAPQPRHSTGSALVQTPTKTPVKKAAKCKRSSSAPIQDEAAELRMEIRNLKQELADSENEVRRLMLFRGYGVEALGAEELAALEYELKHTLQLIRKHRSHPSDETVFTDEEETESTIATTEREEGDDIDTETSCYAEDEDEHYHHAFDPVEDVMHAR